MANAVKGEVALPAVDVAGFESGGTLLLDFNALCALEEELGLEVEEMGDEALRSPRKMRQVFRIGLVEHHGNVDDRTVGKLIQALGPQESGELVKTAFLRSFPEAAGDGAGNPPATATTGDGISGGASKSGPKSSAVIQKRSGGKPRGRSPA